MLSLSESQVLLDILSDESSSFEASLKRFEEAFERPDYFRACWAVQHLIQHKVWTTLTKQLLTQKERLIGLYILCEIYHYDNVRTTPFYQLILNLLASPEDLHVAEHKLLNGFLTSVLRVGKKTPEEYAKEAEIGEYAKPFIDLEPYRKAHRESMPHTHLLHEAAVPQLLVEGPEERAIDRTAQGELNTEEINLEEFLPCLFRPLPMAEANEDYLLQDVRRTAQDAGAMAGSRAQCRSDLGLSRVAKTSARRSGRPGFEAQAVFH